MELSDDDEILIKTYGAAANTPTSSSAKWHSGATDNADVPPIVTVNSVERGNTLDRRPSFSHSDADSELLMAKVDEVTTSRSFEKFRKWWEHPKLRENYKLVVSSILLTVVGSVLILTGIILIAIPNSTGVHGWVFLVAGLLCFIPGIYHTVYVACALNGRKGYDFRSLPTFA